MRFAPLQRFPAHSSSTLVGFASPVRLRPQVFSTSRRVSYPPRACRPCFMPDPLMGLHPSELFSHRLAVRRLRRRSPLGVGPCSSPSLRPAPARIREGRNLLEPGWQPPSRPSRSPGVPNRRRPSRRYRSTVEPNGRPTLESRSSFEPNSGSTLRGRNPFEPNGHPTLGSRSSLLSSRARRREPEGSVRSSGRPSLQDRSPFVPNARPHPPPPKRRRTERPLDPTKPKLR